MREEFENRLKAVEIELQETIVQKKLEAEKRVQRRLQNYHAEMAKRTQAPKKSGAFAFERTVSPASRLESRKNSPVRRKNFEILSKLIRLLVLSPSRATGVYLDELPTRSKNRYDIGYASPKRRDIQQVIFFSLLVTH